MCLQYKPTAVACFCLQLASHWTNWEMPQPKDGKAWFHEIDETLTQELINHLVAKFRHHVGDYYPHLRDKIISFCLRNSPFRPYPSPSDSPGRQPPKVVNPVPVSESHPLPSGPPELKKSLDTELRVPPLHSHPVQHAPYHLHPLPSPQTDRKNHETSESCNQNPTDAKSRDLPNIRHQSIHNSSSHPSADPEHHHPDHHPRHLADHSPHEKPPNSSENHLNTQNTHKTPQTSFITPPESHPRNHVEHLQQPTDDNSLQISPDLQSVGYSKEKIVTSIAPAVPIVESNLEVSDDLLAMVPPENFDFENTFRNVIESLTSMTNSDASRLCKSDPEKTESTQEPSWSLSTFDSTDSGIFSQSSSQPLGQGNVPQESDAPLKRLQEISEPVKSFSSIFDPPDDVNETLVQKFDDNCNDLSDSHKKKKKSKHKKERKEKKKSKKRERTVSPIKLKIPREKLGILGDKIDKDIGLEGSRRRKRQSETHYEVARKRCHGDKGERIRLTYEEVDYIEP
ncbi:sperm head and tail associated protein-like [Diachasmimorpha longicaudata]|uniref:sperm head and tail associated protein-like n=1 Tax=Diachasmimorpha longicaudata TaxID=58733 RepID=UPI0030B8F96B